ncbi:MAG: hypothetical protein RIC14_02130 [Filomicrobium sp.]
MRLLKWIVGIFVVAIVSAISIYVLAYPSTTVRYRLTAEVQTPEGTKTGSVVNEILFYTQPATLTQGSIGRGNRGRGEALVVDLGNRGKLFGLLIGRLSDGSPGDPRPAQMILDLYAPNWRDGEVGYRQALATVAPTETPIELPKKYWPFFVTFRNPDDPTTVESVKANDLSSRFGSGVKLTRMTSQLVDAGVWPLDRLDLSGTPLTSQVKEMLPWLDWPREKMLKTGNGRSPLKMPNKKTKGTTFLDRPHFFKD